MTHSYVGLTQSLIWAGVIIPYLLTSGDIRNRFVNERRRSGDLLSIRRVVAHAASAAGAGRTGWL